VHKVWETIKSKREREKKGRKIRKIKKTKQKNNTNIPESFFGRHRLAVIIDVFKLWQRFVALFIFKFNNRAIETISSRIFVVLSKIRKWNY
jgi:hypothetical protein